MKYGQQLTKSYDYRPELKWEKSEPFFGDLGYTLDLPWPMVTTAGWWQAGTIPEEKALIMSDQPEWHAVNNTVRVNQGLPEIDVNNPIYQYQRSDNTIKLLRALE